MNACLVTGTLYRPTGVPWAGGVVRFRLIRRFASADGVAVPERVPDAAEIERRDAPGQLRQALALLATWQDDALSAAELGALTTAQRIARQAASEQRVAVLARMIRRLVIVQRLEG